MEIIRFPNELLLLIAGALDRPRDIHALLCTNRHFANLLTPLLHKHAVEDKDGMSALQWASAKGYKELVGLLLEKDPNIDFNFFVDTYSPGLSRRTALFLATEEAQSVAIITLLLEGGADINFQDGYGETALYGAVRCDTENTLPILQLLLDKGADPSIECRSGFTALHEVLDAGRESVANLMLATSPYIDIAAGDEYSTELHFAACSGLASSMKLLLDLGADVFAQNYCLDTALHMAASGGYEAATRLLLENNADVTMENSIGETALDSALAEANSWDLHDLATVRVLLENPLAGGIYSRTTLNRVLEWATRVGCEGVVEQLAGLGFTGRPSRQ